MFSVVKLIAVMFTVIVVVLKQPDLTWVDAGKLGMLVFVFVELIAIHETIKYDIPKEIVVKVQDANTTGDAWS